MTGLTTLPAMRRPRTSREIAEAIRVTHVVLDFDGGGLESIVAELANRFHGSAVHVSLVTLNGREGRLGAATRDRFGAFEVIRPLPVASMALPLRAALSIRRTRPDVVHLHTGAWFKGARAARLAGANRVVYTEHGREHYDPPLMRWLDHRASTITDAVVAVSDRLAEYLARVVGVSREKICTVHNGVDTSAFTPGPAPAALRAALGIPDGALVFGSIGRLETVKAHETLLDAAALLREGGHPSFIVLLCGDGSQREALQARAARLGIQDIVFFNGWTEQPIDAYRSMDVFVLPSRSEGLSVSLLEAMSCGLPAVVTDVGANAELLGLDLRAHVVPPDDPSALAHALAAIARAPSLAAIRALVRRRTVEHYSIERMIEQYERVYRGTFHPTRS